MATAPTAMGAPHVSAVAPICASDMPMERNDARSVHSRRTWRAKVCPTKINPVTAAMTATAIAARAS